MSFADIKVDIKADNEPNIVTCTFTGVPATKENITSYLLSIDTIYKKKQKFILLYDARLIKKSTITFDHICRQAKFMRDKDEETRKFVEMCAIVICPETKSILKLLFRLKQPACKLKICTDLNTANNYIKLSTRIK